MNATPPKPSAGARALIVRHVGLIGSCAVALSVLGPLLLGRGFLLRYDMVFTPHLPLSTTTLGTAGQVPRAVPNDIIVALTDLVLPGALTQRLVLFGFFAMIGMGVDRWRVGARARLATTVLLCWNPWIGERLSIGHWGYLWGYAAAVWVLVGALQWRTRATVTKDVTTVLVGLAVGAASGSSGAVLGAITLAVVALAPGRGRASMRAALGTLGLWLGLNAAWWYPFLALAPSHTADAAGVSAFSSSADGAGGVVLSVLGGGGIWHSPSWFAERSSLLVSAVAALILILGAVMAARRFGAMPIGPLGGIGLFLALAGALPGARDVLTAIVLHVPGGGLLRDGQKFATLWVLPAAMGFGLGVELLWRRGRGSLLAPVVSVAGACVPLVLLPSLAWAHDGAWRTSAYPTSWVTDAHIVDARGGGAASLPWSTYRRYAWNDDQVLLDPWNRLVRVPVVSDDSFTLHRHGHEEQVAGESASGARIARAIADDAPIELNRALRDAGIRTAIVQDDQPDAEVQRRLLERSGARLVHVDTPGHLRLYAIEGAARPTAPSVWAATGLASSGATLVLIIAVLLRRRHFSTHPAQNRSRG